MRIVVTSQNFNTITGHAGRARRFLVFDADGVVPPKEVERLDLDANMTIHGFDHRAQHPLDSMDVMITGGAGEGFIRQMEARGVQVVATSESDPRLAMEAFFAGRVKSPSEGCNHSDHDNHGDGGNTCDCHPKD